MVGRGKYEAVREAQLKDFNREELPFNELELQKIHDS